jgi:hypothetical protein
LHTIAMSSSVDPVTTATLLIFGGEFEPSDVSKHLGLAPWRSWRKGEKQSYVRKDGSTILFDSLNEWSGWKHKLPEELSLLPLETQLEAWCELLGARKQGLKLVRNMVENIHLDCCIVCSSTTRFIISPLIQGALAQLEVSLAVTYYTHEEPESAI